MTCDKKYICVSGEVQGRTVKAFNLPTCYRLDRKHIAAYVERLDDDKLRGLDLSKYIILTPLPNHDYPDLSEVTNDKR